MKFHPITLFTFLLSSENGMCFMATKPYHSRLMDATTKQFKKTSNTKRSMVMVTDMPQLPPTSTTSSYSPSVAANQNQLFPTVQEKTSFGLGGVRYSDFLKLVRADRIERVTFSADGTKLVGTDVDRKQLTLEALPNDPDLLRELTEHKV